MAMSRNTRQKELLLKEAKKFRTFFTAEELLSRANKIDARIGIATVYRFLKDLTSKGVFHSYLCDRKTIYSMGKRSHCHFTCEKCGKVEHIDVNSLDFAASKIKGSVCHFQIDVSGICEKCGKAESS